MEVVPADLARGGLSIGSGGGEEPLPLELPRCIGVLPREPQGEFDVACPRAQVGVMKPPDEVELGP